MFKPKKSIDQIYREFQPFPNLLGERKGKKTKEILKDKIRNSIFLFTHNFEPLFSTVFTEGHQTLITANRQKEKQTCKQLATEIHINICTYIYIYMSMSIYVYLKIVKIHPRNEENVLGPQLTAVKIQRQMGKVNDNIWHDNDVPQHHNDVVNDAQDESGKCVKN